MGNKIVITEDCISCGACIELCPVEAIKMKATQAQIDEKCILCGSCLGVCPVDAIVEKKK